MLCVGYAFIQITGLQHGCWILLTSLFVCQPNYNRHPAIALPAYYRYGWSVSRIGLPRAVLRAFC